MNANNISKTKPAVKSTTLWAAILTIAGIIIELATSYNFNGTVSGAEIGIAIPLVIGQAQIISERLKERRTPIKGVV